MNEQPLNPYEAPRAIQVEEPIVVANAATSEEVGKKTRRARNPLARGLPIDLLVICLVAAAFDSKRYIEVTLYVCLFHLCISQLLMVWSKIQKVPLSQFHLAFIR
jgi:hypothetical protein